MVKVASVYISISRAPRVVAMVSELVSLEQLRLNKAFDPRWITHTFGIVLLLIYAWKITISRLLSYLMFDHFLLI